MVCDDLWASVGLARCRRVCHRCFLIRHGERGRKSDGRNRASRLISLLWCIWPRPVLLPIILSVRKATTYPLTQAAAVDSRYYPQEEVHHGHDVIPTASIIRRKSHMPSHLGDEERQGDCRVNPKP